MENARHNPLAGYFRQPAIYVSLPSKGRWWKDGALSLPENGEIPVFPMSTKDEITLKTPDALINGQGVVNVIQSCCPNIIDAWEMPSIDVDMVLIAIRVASYGSAMDFDSKCPHCGEENSHEVNLTSKLSELTVPEFKDAISINNLKIKFKPQRYYSVNKASMMEFEEEQLMKALNMPNTDQEVKTKMIDESMERIVDLSIRTIANGTEYIEISGDERVTDVDFINEFYQNADAAIVTTVNNQLAKITSEAKSMILELECNECKKSYAVDLTFDYSSFFGKRS